MEKFTANAKSIQNLTSILKLAHSIILSKDTPNNFIYENLVFTNSTESLMKNLQTSIKTSTIKKNHIYYRGFKLFTIYYSNIKNSVFYRDILYRVNYNPKNLSKFNPKYYTVINTGQPMEIPKILPVISKKNHIICGTHAYNYYSGENINDVYEYITTNSKNMQDLPIYDDKFLKYKLKKNNIYYNSAQYELIPHYNNYASPPVILRFFIVRMYLKKYVLKTSYTFEKHMHNKILKLNPEYNFPESIAGTYIDTRLLYH